MPFAHSKLPNGDLGGPFVTSPTWLSADDRLISEAHTQENSMSMTLPLALSIEPRPRPATYRPTNMLPADMLTNRLARAPIQPLRPHEQLFRAGDDKTNIYQVLEGMFV